jgi:hypothetical protein
MLTHFAHLAPFPKNKVAGCYNPQGLSLGQMNHLSSRHMHDNQAKMKYPVCNAALVVPTLPQDE